MMDRIEMIDRRSFVIFTAAAALLLKLPRSSFAAERQARLVRIVTYIPRRIFFSTRSSGNQVLLSALDLTDEDKAVAGSFSNGQTIQFALHSSSLSIVQKSNGQRVTRQSVLPKSLAAWVIDAVWKSLHNKRNPTAVARLRGSFESFQGQSVLDAVTPVSLYNLVRDTGLRKQITLVAWNGKALRFDVK